MVVASDGVLKVAPDPRLEPPVDAEYQLMVPPEAVAESATEEVPQADAGVVPVIVGMVLIVATTETLGEEVQPLVVAST